MIGGLLGGLTPDERIIDPDAPNPSRYARAVELVGHRADTLRRVFNGGSLKPIIAATYFALEVSALTACAFLNDLAKASPSIFEGLSPKETFGRCIQVWNAWIVAGVIVPEGYPSVDAENLPAFIQHKAYPGLAGATVH